MERCHFVFLWCVTRSRRTKDCLKFPASPLLRHRIYLLPQILFYCFFCMFFVFFTVCWFVAGGDRTPALHTAPPARLLCISMAGYLWLPAQNRTSLGPNYGNIVIMLITLLKDKIKLYWFHPEKLAQLTPSVKQQEGDICVVLCCVIFWACDAVKTTLTSQIRCDFII